MNVVTEAWDACVKAQEEVARAILCALGRALAHEVVGGDYDHDDAMNDLRVACRAFGVNPCRAFDAYDEATNFFGSELDLVKWRPVATVRAAWHLAKVERFADLEAASPFKSPTPWAVPA